LGSFVIPVDFLPPSLGLQSFPLSKEEEEEENKTKHVLKAAEISSATSAGKE